MRKRDSYERAIMFGAYFIATKSTVRETGKRFGYSKSAVHKSLTQVLPEISPSLAGRVREVLDKNLQERHIRGGESTRKRFAIKVGIK